MHKITLAALLLSTSTWVFAHNITEETLLPAISVSDKGELLYDGAKDNLAIKIGIADYLVAKYAQFNISLDAVRLKR